MHTGSRERKRKRKISPFFPQKDNSKSSTLRRKRFSTPRVQFAGSLRKQSDFLFIVLPACGFLHRVLVLQNNQISTSQHETFCKVNSSHYTLHNMEEGRLDGNPVTLSQHPNSFICVHRMVQLKIRPVTETKRLQKAVLMLQLMYSTLLHSDRTL